MSAIARFYYIRASLVETKSGQPTPTASTAEQSPVYSAEDRDEIADALDYSMERNKEVPHRLYHLLLSTKELEQRKL